ncbi:MAG: hypothetical protein HRU19_23750 [Pseudobacteriovorax sp.]|nr:hypothetical protein [Pseudobacteriovorax sp.]
MINEEQVKNWLEYARNKFIERDSILLDLEVHEQTMTHRFAVYLEEVIVEDGYDFHVDCEYNKDERHTKKLDSDDKSVRPDIIVHIRDSLANILAIEAKKGEKISAYDSYKLNGYLEKLNYQWAAQVLFPCDGNHPVKYELLN